MGYTFTHSFLKKNTNTFNFVFIFAFIFCISSTQVSFGQVATSTSIQLTASNTSPVAGVDFKYIKIIDSCNFNFGITGCVAARAGPSSNSKKVARLRNGIVLRVTDIVTSTSTAKQSSWYKVSFAREKLVYPERASSTWYVNAKYAEPVYGVDADVYGVDADVYDPNKIYPENKVIKIDLSDQTLSAYEDNNLFIKTKISTGLRDTPTLPGEYYITYRTPSRYMQGPDKLATTTPKIVTATTTGYYDLPGVPWTMYFADDGSAIHGAYWHNNFGRNHSHGCINLNLKDAEKMYRWTGVGVSVLITR